MFFATIGEAFGVDTLEKKEETNQTMPVERVKFSRELLGETPDSNVTDDIPTMIPEERRLTDLEVRQYISKMYTKQGMRKVWSLIDPRIKRRIVETCNKSAKNTQKWFEDILSSPEKLLIILAVIFVLILLIDSTSKKTETAVAPTTYRPAELMYYQTYPSQFSHQPELRW